MGGHENRYAKPSDVWCTPPQVLEPIYKYFGKIGLDPCAEDRPLTQGAHSNDPEHNWSHFNVVAERHYTLDLNGLRQSWDKQGLVYVNPPFSDIAPWVEKAAKEGDEVILLLPCRTGSVWWQTWVAPADVILFWKGRLKFVGAKDYAPFHCALVYWGTRTELFLEAFPGRWHVRNNAA